jgi:hypothetical protein
MRAILVLLIPLLQAAEQRVEVTKTERVNFAPGGTIRVDGSYGNLNVEGWERPEVEITFVKSTQKYYELKQREKAAARLDSVTVSIDRRSNTELAISTNRRAGVSVGYEIRAPRDSRIEIRHGTGQVIVENVTGDIHATAHRGDILLMLPDTGTYTIDAKTKVGVVTSDFVGDLHRRPYLLGERFASPSASHRVYLRVGLGGIAIKSVSPEAEPPVTTSAQ